MSKALIGVGAVVLFLSVPAYADWVQIATSSSSAKWYMDAERIRPVNGKMQTWVKIDYRADRSVQYSEAKVLMSFDCAAETYKTLSDVRYDSYGKIISSTNTPDYGLGIGYEPVVPDTMAETVEKLACLGK